MDYQLNLIDSLIGQILSKESVLVKEEAQSLKASLVSECERVKLAFKQKVLMCENEELIVRYFEIHEQSLIDQIDAMLESKLNCPADTFDFFHAHLESLLSFIKDHFSRYFNASLKAPCSFRNKIMKELKSKMARLATIFLECDVNKDLVAIAMEPIHKALDSSNQNFSYQQLSYLKLLQDYIIKFSDMSNDKGQADNTFMMSLVKINFNDNFFFSYYTGMLTRYFNACETLTDRIDLAAFHLKAVQQIDVKPSVAYEPWLPSIKEQLLEWLIVELDYLKQKRLLQLSCPSKEEEDVKKDFKLNFDLSVSHLAFLIKTFADTGVLQNKNTCELIRFLTRFVKTKKSEAVSYDSFRMKYYNTETGTKDAVKRTLQVMLNYINKN